MGLAQLDLGDIQFSPPAPEKGIVKRLSQRHRNLARLLAQGVEPGRCAMILRYDPSRVSVLQTDPAFRQLVEFYRTVADEEFKRNAEKLAELSEDAIDALSDRLEENPGDFSPSQLIELVKVTADRTGLGPTSTTRHLHMAVTPATLAALKERLAGDNAGTVELISSFSGQVLGGSADDAGAGTADEAGQDDSDTEGGSTIPS